MSGRLRLPWLSAVGGAAVLGLVVWGVGTGPFLAGLGAVGPASAGAALALGVLTTLCCVWRWREVAAALGVALPAGTAVAAYYRSQFLNSVLPTGILGDVHRALRHGRALGDVGLAGRAVVLERAGSLIAQAAIAAMILLVLSSPLRGSAVVAVGTALAVAVAAVLVARSRGVDRRLGLVVVVSSGLDLAGHLAVFLVAARAAGSTARLPGLVAPVLLALLAMALPVSLAGWGPREGVAAWAFGATGLGAAQGVSAAVAYGVLSLIACLPGAGVLVGDALRAAPRVRSWLRSGVVLSPPERQWDGPPDQGRTRDVAVPQGGAYE